jgi:Mg2+ and Co2+ transporter CorA
MGQRVNIQYSINIDDLPKKILHMVARAHARLEESAKALEKMGSKNEEDVLTLQVVDNISICRDRLIDVDVALNDMTNIISSYIKFKSQENDSQPEQAPNLVSPDAQKLQELITNFKDSMNSDEVTD